MHHVNAAHDTCDRILALEYKGLSKESANNSLAPKLFLIHSVGITLKFEGSCLKQNITSFSHRTVNLFIVYELNTWSRDLITDFKLDGYLFGAIKLTKATDINEYGYIMVMKLDLMHVKNVHC